MTRPPIGGRVPEHLLPPSSSTPARTLRHRSPPSRRPARDPDPHGGRLLLPSTVGMNPERVTSGNSITDGSEQDASWRVFTKPFLLFRAWRPLAHRMSFLSLWVFSSTRSTVDRMVTRASQHWAAFRNLPWDPLGCCSHHALTAELQESSPQGTGHADTQLSR